MLGIPRTFLIIAPYKYSYLLTYLLTYMLSPLVKRTRHLHPVCPLPWLRLVPTSDWLIAVARKVSIVPVLAHMVSRLIRASQPLLYLTSRRYQEARMVHCPGSHHISPVLNHMGPVNTRRRLRFTADALAITAGQKALFSLPMSICSTERKFNMSKSSFCGLLAPGS